jgi:hypothetical protein
MMIDWSWLRELLFARAVMDWTTRINSRQKSTHDLLWFNIHPSWSQNYIVSVVSLLVYWN